ncbi:MAG: c(7)-type cytochrome triheme domain-containing protein [Myxococcaceae bacterium]
MNPWFKRLAPALFLASMALADPPGGARMPKLPKPIFLPQAEASPGQVSFDHATHVDEARPDCTSCHSKLFPIVRWINAAPRGPIVHERMDQGAQCGACHNGTKAFDLTTCELCHQEPKEGATP